LILTFSYRGCRKQYAGDSLKEELEYRKAMRICRENP
jgi:hypothetical protein